MEIDKKTGKPIIRLSIDESNFRLLQALADGTGVDIEKLLEEAAQVHQHPDRDTWVQADTGFTHGRNPLHTAAFFNHIMGWHILSS